MKPLCWLLTRTSTDTMLQISSPARIHMTLIDLGTDGYRKNGGIGFAVTGSDVKLAFRASKFNDISQLARIGFSENEILRLQTKLLRIQAAKSLASVHLIQCEAETIHSGFGVGTAVSLALVEAIFLLSGIEVDRDEIAALSGRGGTSGIGVNTYFEGGFVLDIGRPRDSLSFASSDDHEGGHRMPTVLSRLEMPQWPLGILIPSHSNVTPLESERALFATVLPLQSVDVHSISYHSVFGVASAVADADYDAFCLATNSLQETAWKNAEIQAHGPAQREAMLKLLDLGCDGVGMSSVGPAIYFMSRDRSTVVEKIIDALPGSTVLLANCQNHGRTVIHA
jgi:beta-ribofuranosylaminobenzene 5'-phosphate synthase